MILGRMAAIVPGHPLRGAGGKFRRVALQFGEVIEGVGVTQFAGVDQTHEQVAHLGAMQRAIEQRIFAMQHGALERAFADVMPTPGLCRAGITWMARLRGRSYFRASVTRHNHNASRKASSESSGRNRSGGALVDVACASAFSLSSISA